MSDKCTHCGQSGLGINLRFVITIFLAGMAWGSLMWTVRDLRADVTSLQIEMSKRVANIEHYLTAQSKGQWQPDPPGDPK